MTDVSQWRTIQGKPGDIMEFIETPIFTRQVLSLISDDNYRALQAVLADHPDLGVLIPGSGGIRKVRWSALGHGKRGGLRVIYYWFVSGDRILFLMAYPKSEQDNLSPDQLKVLRQVVEKYKERKR